MYVSLFAGVLSLPVLESLLAAVAGIHALLAGGPLARANLAILFNMLESLNEAENLIHVTADGEVVELTVSQNTLAIDDKGGTEVQGIISGEATIVAAELLGQVSKHGDLHSTEATLLAGFVGELLVSEVGVN
jgi:hypothetical protein